MAKPLGQKSLVIRQAITANPDKGNTEIAELINDSQDRLDDKIKVKAQDVAQQRQAMKKSGAAPTVAAAAPPPPPSRPAAKKGRKGGRKPQQATAEPQAAAPVAQRGPAELVEKTLELASQAGGVAALKKLVDVLAAMR